MKLNKYIIFIFAFLIFVCSGFGQNIDSLWKIFNDNTKSDTVRLNAIGKMTSYYLNSNPDSVILLVEKEMPIINSLKKTLRNRYTSSVSNKLGAAYFNTGNFVRSLNYYLKSLKIDEETGNSDGIITLNINIGEIYRYQSKFDKALNYYSEALLEAERIKDKKAIGVCYNYYGIAYLYSSDFNKALEFFFKSLKIMDEFNDIRTLGGCNVNIATAYQNLSMLPEAEEYYKKGLKILVGTNNKDYIASCYGGLSELYLRTEDYQKVLSYNDSCLKIANEIGDIHLKLYTCNVMALTYSKMKNYKNAYEYHVKFKQLTDSVFNIENSKQLGDIKTQFEVDKKETELKLKAQGEQDKLKAIASEEKKRQKIVIILVSCVLALVVVFSFFLYKRFRITNRQKLIIEQQKVLVDKAYESLHEKNKEVMDSINYAKRIQTALLPTCKYISKHLKK